MIDEPDILLMSPDPVFEGIGILDFGQYEFFALKQPGVAEILIRLKTRQRQALFRRDFDARHGQGPAFAKTLAVSGLLIIAQADAGSAASPIGQHRQWQRKLAHTLVSNCLD